MDVATVTKESRLMSGAMLSGLVAAAMMKARNGHLTLFFANKFGTVGATVLLIYILVLTYRVGQL
jgi:tetrahydromethanopterin S-methyltransferase subunit D